MSVEEWAARLVSKELGVTAEVHDDNSAPEMYDVRVGPADSPNMAIECVGAVDPVRTETWNVGLADGEPVRLNLRGDWGVSIRRDARIKELPRVAQRVLSRLEEDGVDRLERLHPLRREDPDLLDICDRVGILGASRVRSEGSGEAYLWMEGIGGAVNTSGEGVAEWVEEFLLDPEHSDVLRKLARSGAPQREVFIPLDFGGLPWRVESYFSSDSTELPPSVPTLPPEVTGVWVIGSVQRLRLVDGTWARIMSIERYRLRNDG